MLREFFAVTATSIYHVLDRDETGCPEAKKIALRGQSRLNLGDKLENGTMIAVCKVLQMYVPEGGGYSSFERKLEAVNTRYWGGHSSPIVALFLKESDARSCFESFDLQPCDSRWLEFTKAVISAIDKDHPTFEVCRFPDLALIDREY